MIDKLSKYCKIFTGLLIFHFCCSDAFSNENNSEVLSEKQLVSDAVVSFQDITGLKDTSLLQSDYFYGPDDTIRSKTDKFYDTLQHKADKNKFTKEILDLIIVKPSHDNGKIATQSETPYLDYQGKIIRKISLKQLDVFGPTVEDTTIKATGFLARTGNRLHINTSRRILEKNLLIKNGSRLDAYKLADNERIIRALPFIYDARFLVKPVQTSTDSVDVVLITKDLWAIGFGLEFSGLDKGRISIWHRNLFGFGGGEQNTIFWDAGEKPLLGYEGIYHVNNLAGSFVNSEFRFISNHGTLNYFADFQRSFFTPQIKYAGGFRFENMKTIEDLELSDTVFMATHFSLTGYNFWIGRSFKLNNENFITRNRSNLMFAGRIYSLKYHDRPDVRENYLYRFQNRTQFIGVAAISTQGFYKSRLVYGFGQTEDIPYGYLVQLIGGYEINEFKNRPYFGLSVSNGIYLKKRGGYLYNKFELGGFVDNRSIEQGTLAFTAKYFTPLFSHNRFKIRYFGTLTYKAGILRYPEEFISIQDKDGLPGLTSRSLKGTKKLTLNLEAVTFTPYYFVGFRFVFFGFVDMGLISPGEKWIFSNKLYSGLGLGIRLRNERLVFNTLQIKFAYYPLIPPDSQWQYIQASEEQRLKMDNFYISDPHIIQY